MRHGLPFALALLLAACGDRETGGAPEPDAAELSAAAAAVEAAAQDAGVPGARPRDPNVLSAEGYGPVRVGMTEPEAMRALGAGVQGGSGATDDCHLLWRGAPPANVVYMVEKGRVTRVTVQLDSAVKTDRGLGVGDTEAEVRAAYPEGLEVEPHKYIGEPAHYLTVWTAPGRGIRYETDAQGVVREIHAGDETIRYVEGCS